MYSRTSWWRFRHETNCNNLETSLKHVVKTHFVLQQPLKRFTKPMKHAQLATASLHRVMCWVCITLPFPRATPSDATGLRHTGIYALRTCAHTHARTHARRAYIGKGVWSPRHRHQTRFHLYGMRKCVSGGDCVCSPPSSLRTKSQNHAYNQVSRKILPE